MKLQIIQADCVDIYCFIGLKHQIFNVLKQPLSPPPHKDKQIKIIFLVTNLILKEYTKLMEALKGQFSEQFDKYMINVLMMKNQNEINQHLNSLQKVNQPEFEENYMKLKHQTQRQMEKDVLMNYIRKKLKWNDVKTNYFLQKNKIETVGLLLNYKGLPKWEENIIDKTLNFLRFCEQKQRHNFLNDK